MSTFAVLIARLLPIGLGIQSLPSRRAYKASHSSSDAPEDEETVKMQPKYLDADEVKERGSYCLDGSVPIFHHREGEEGKWVIWLSTNEVCANASVCTESLEKAGTSGSDTASPSKLLQTYGNFINYHHVQINNCDSGFYMGDKDTPRMVNGSNMYFQGGRIMKHVIDTLSKNYSMTDVLVAGGSGGGMSLFAGKYLIESIMPDTVVRFGMVPMNGWYEELDAVDVKSGFQYHEMSANVAPECKDDYVGAEDKCMNPSVSYSYGDANMFVVQMFDYTFNKAHPEVFDDYMDCLYNADNCTNDKAANVANFWNTYLSNFTQYPRYSASGQGGFISTCTSHTFYNSEDDFYAFKVGGVTVGEAVWTWWESLEGGSSPAQWYFPCEMGSTPATIQCESTCQSSSTEVDEE